MSGPKTGRLRATPQSRVNTALVDVSRALAGSAALASGGPAKLLAETSSWLTSLRQEQAQIQKGAKAPRSSEEASKWQKIEQLREDLALAVAEEQSTCASLEEASRDAESASEAAREWLRESGNSAAFASIESRLRKAADLLNESRRSAERAERRIGRQRAQLRALLPQRVQADPGARDVARGVSGRDATPGATKDGEVAARAALRDQLAKLARPPEGGWEEAGKWTSPQNSSRELQTLLLEAERLIASDDLASAAAWIERVAVQREALEREAEANRAAAQRVRSVAEAAMMALCDRHYKTPRFGEIQPGDPMSGIRIRADVPSSDGCGNVRIDLHADGRAEFEIENVSTGEEDICRSIMGGFVAAFAAEGMELEVTEWGRAAEGSSEQTPKRQTPERVQEKTQTRQRRGNSGRVDGPGGHRA